VMDAHRQQFFAATFDYPPAGDRDPPTVTLIEQDAWPASLDAKDAASGPGLSLVESSGLPAGVTIAPQEHWSPRADTLALLAGEALDAGRGVEPWRLLPNYYRLSAAEEKANATPSR
ncbi:MAG: hypothetical protein AAGG46_07875, partial [Planctomycetota bacterium]